MSLKLTLIERTAQRLDCSALVPDRLAGMTPAEIAAIELPCGRRSLKLGELFRIEGSPGAEVVIAGAADNLDRLGANMADGTLRVEGEAGAYLGIGMKGGTIRLSGNAGIFAACGMRGGHLEIGGNAGRFLGGGLPGDKRGMRGGLVLVRGNAGERCGDQMRRGAILVEGDAGDYCGSRMIAGTIAVLGKAGELAGFSMKRGTLLLTQAPASIPATFNDCGSHTFAVLPLLLRSWQGLSGRFGSLPSFTRARRIMGDMACAGRGEILVRA